MAWQRAVRAGRDRAPNWPPWRRVRHLGAYRAGEVDYTAITRVKARCRPCLTVRLKVALWLTSTHHAMQGERA